MAVVDRRTGYEAPQNLLDDHLNPFAPIPSFFKTDQSSGGSRYNQRLRRSEILATIRRLVTEEGCENVTVRQVAGMSGYAVQTIYNLVGPKNDAISDAVSEYSIFVAKVANLKPDDPSALPSMVNSWLEATRLARGAELTRQFSLAYFGPNRSIYYRFRDRQQAGMRKLLLRQKGSGIIRSDVDVNALAEHIAIFSSALWLDWADRQFSMDLLQQKLSSGLSNLLEGKLEAEHEHILGDWLRTASNESSRSLSASFT